MSSKTSHATGKNEAIAEIVHRRPDVHYSGVMALILRYGG